MTDNRPQNTIPETHSSPSRPITQFSEPVEEAFAETLHKLRTLKLFSWNIWLGGREIDDSAAKQAAVLDAEGADIVFLQECFGDAGVQLGRRTGMTVAQQDYDCAVLSASPIRRLATDTASYATAAVVQTRGGDVLAWSVHLAPWDYGPYRSEELPGNAAEVFDQPGERKRTAEAQQILSETQRLKAELGDIPVIVAGDFNVPTGLDWTGAHRPQLQWPATQAFLDAGFTDAFRASHPDPATAPGLSWSQIETLETEPRDRIDFIYVLGMEVVTADHLGGAADDSDAPADLGFTEYGGTARHIPDHRGNAFPSDHLAVRATLRNL